MKLSIHTVLLFNISMMISVNVLRTTSYQHRNGSAEGTDLQSHTMRLS